MGDPTEKRGLEPERTPRWSAERRARFIRARSTPGLVCAPADRSRREHKAGAPLGTPPPLIAEGQEVEGVPGALQTIRAVTHGCLIIESEGVLLSTDARRAAALFPLPLAGEGGVRVSGRRVRGATGNDFAK